MKKLQSSLKNMVLVLVGVALVTGGVLALVNHLTEAPIKAKEADALASGIKAVMGTDELTVAEPVNMNANIGGKDYEFVIHNATDKEGNPLGAAVESTTMGFADKLQVLVGFNQEGQILGYTILKSAETPGLGAKADKWFQKDGKGSIIGLTPAETPLTVKKDGGQVDAITASTITSRAFLKAVNQAYEAYAKQQTILTAKP